MLVDDSYQRLIAKRGVRLRTSGPELRFSDSEVITVSLIIETFFQGHEEVGYAFVGQYMRDLFPQLIDLDWFNQRRRDLIAVIEAIRRDLRYQKLDQQDTLRLADSAPISLMTYTRGGRSRSVVGSQYFGVVTSKKGKIFGLRLHATVTRNQLIDDWCLAPASMLDPKVLPELLHDKRDLIVIGDKLFNDSDEEDWLWQDRHILLLPLRKVNQHNQWPDGVQQTLGWLRHGIETVFSVLTNTLDDHV